MKNAIELIDLIRQIFNRLAIGRLNFIQICGSAPIEYGVADFLGVALL